MNIMNKSSRKKLILITVGVVLLAALFSAFAFWQIYNYEQGVAELYAQEQDRYQTEYQTSQTKPPSTYTFREHYYTTNDIAFLTIKV